MRQVLSDKLLGFVATDPEDVDQVAFLVLRILSLDVLLGELGRCCGVLGLDLLITHDTGLELGHARLFELLSFNCLLIGPLETVL